TAAARQVTSDRITDHDYPAAAAAKDGTVYVAYISFTPGLDRNERSRNWESDPGDLGFLTKAPGGAQLLVRIIKGSNNGEEAEIAGIAFPIAAALVAVEAGGEADVGDIDRAVLRGGGSGI